MRDETHTLMSVRFLVTSAPKIARKKGMRDETHTLMSVRFLVTSAPAIKRKKCMRDAYLDVCAVEPQAAQAVQDACLEEAHPAKMQLQKECCKRVAYRLIRLLDVCMWLVHPAKMELQKGVAQRVVVNDQGRH